MIGHDLDGALVELQEQAESTMTTPCRIHRAGAVTADPGTGADVIVAGALVYDGSRGDPGCKIQTRENQPRDVESGQATVTEISLEVHVPVLSGPYRVGDVVLILDRPAGSVVVRSFRVEGTHVKTYQTAQRLPVVETAVSV